jgi:heme/copper-type cytochrome/quinol oxidase subunit 2
MLCCARVQSGCGRMKRATTRVVAAAIVTGADVWTVTVMLLSLLMVMVVMVMVVVVVVVVVVVTARQRQPDPLLSQCAMWRR